MRSHQATQRNTRGLLIEGVVIVLSILLAFAIDAWWDERQERVLESEILLGLQQEFAGNKTDLEERIGRHHEMLNSHLVLLEAAHQGYWQSEGLSIDRAFAHLASPPTTDLGSGVLDALISAGRLGVLSSRELRVRLAAWKSIYLEVHDDEVMNRAFVFDRVLPYAMKSGMPMSAALSSFSDVEWPSKTRSLADDPDSLNRLWSDPEFTSLLEVRLGFLSHTTGEYETALDEITVIMELIDQSLAAFTQAP